MFPRPSISSDSRGLWRDLPPVTGVSRDLSVGWTDGLLSPPVDCEIDKGALPPAPPLGKELDPQGIECRFGQDTISGASGTRISE